MSKLAVFIVFFLYVKCRACEYMEQAGRRLGMGSSFVVARLEFGMRAKVEVQAYEPRLTRGLRLVPSGVLL